MKQIVPSGRLFNSFTLIGPQRINLLFLRKGFWFKNYIYIFALIAAANNGTKGVADINIRSFQILVSSIVFMLWKDKFWNSSITFRSPTLSLAGD